MDVSESEERIKMEESTYNIEYVVTPEAKIHERDPKGVSKHGEEDIPNEDFAERPRRLAVLELLRIRQLQDAPSFSTPVDAMQETSVRLT